MYTYEIIQDEYPADPRTDYDNATVFAFAHRRYNLGDTDGWDKLRDALRDNVRKLTMAERQDLDNGVSFERLVDIFRRHDLGLAVPVYMMDHSGLSFTTNRGYFQAADPQGWDWGCIGIVFVTWESAKKELGRNRRSKRVEEAARQWIEGEVETYHQYQGGDVWGYRILDEDDEVVDSGWGFYGYKYAEEEAKMALESWRNTGGT